MDSSCHKKVQNVDPSNISRHIEVEVTRGEVSTVEVREKRPWVERSTNCKRNLGDIKELKWSNRGTVEKERGRGGGGRRVLLIWMEKGWEGKGRRERRKRRAAVAMQMWRQAEIQDREMEGSQKKGSLLNNVIHLPLQQTHLNHCHSQFIFYATHVTEILSCHFKF